MAVGIEVAGPLDNARERCRFVNIEVANVFAEVGLRSLAESMDAETAALAETDLIAVILEDLLLRQLLLEFEGNHHLRGFALPILVLVEPELPRQLHAERGSALILMARFQIHVSSHHHAQR